MDRRLATLTISTFLLCAACGQERIRTRTDLDDGAETAAVEVRKADRAALKSSAPTTSAIAVPPTTAAAPTTTPPAPSPPATGPPSAPPAQAADEGLPIAEILELFGPAASDGVVSPGEALFLQIGLRSEGLDEIADAATPEWLTLLGGQVCTAMADRPPASEIDFYVLVGDLVATNGADTAAEADLLATLSLGGAMFSCADRFGFALVTDA